MANAVATTSANAAAAGGHANTAAAAHVPTNDNKVSAVPGLVRSRVIALFTEFSYYTAVSIPFRDRVHAHTFSSRFV